MPEATPFQPGDRCRYASAFLRSTNQLTGPDAPTDQGPWARGTVLNVTPFDGTPDLVQVIWDNNRIGRALASNLERCDG